jgi:hypothetical protein
LKSSGFIDLDLYCNENSLLNNRKNTISESEYSDYESDNSIVTESDKLEEITRKNEAIKQKEDKNEPLIEEFEANETNKKAINETDKIDKTDEIENKKINEIDIDIEIEKFKDPWDWD